MQESALVAYVYELAEKKKLENTLAILTCRRLYEVLFSTSHGIKCFCISLIINFWTPNLETSLEDVGFLKSIYLLEKSAEKYLVET